MRERAVEDRKIVVLVVEDNQFFLKMQRIMLERAGFTVITANDGQQGLDIFKQFRDELDVVVTDLMMPRLNGLELCRRIREQKPATPVVLVTGAGEEVEPGSGGFDAAMRKPFDPRDLVEVVKQLASLTPRERRERQAAHGE